MVMAPSSLPEITVPRTPGASQHLSRPLSPHLLAMCGRVAQNSDPDRLARRFCTAGAPPNVPPRWNAAPTDNLLVVRYNPSTRQRQLDALIWGLVPRWAKDTKGGAMLINARAESCTTRPAFRDAFRRRRCLVPVDAFYEWLDRPDGKQPFAIAALDGEPLALAGMWDGWRAPDGKVVATFTIITAAANELVAPVHERMPVVLAPDAWPSWLGEQDATETELKALLQPYPAASMRMWAVGRRVNRTGEEGADLLSPVSE